MRKIFAFLRDLTSVLMVLAVAFGAGYYYCHLSDNNAAEVVVEQETAEFDLEMPLEVEKRVVTVEEVEAKLLEIGELSTYAGEYTCTQCKEETRYCMENILIPGTKNVICITCDGIVKVGYNMSDIEVRVDDDIIYVSIPKAKLNDNYVVWDSVKCSETNSILNPIEFSQYQEIVSEIEEMGLKQVTEQGIYVKAEENLKVLIDAFLSEFEDYEVVYL